MMEQVGSPKIWSRWSLPVVLTTVLALAVLGTAFGVLTAVSGNLGFILFVGALILGSLLYALCLMPVYLRADPEKVTIGRLFRPKRIGRGEIVRIVPLGREQVRPLNRQFGSGGLFGYLGVFSAPGLGAFYMYATELDHLVLIETRTRKYVVSCRKPELLVGK